MLSRSSTACCSHWTHGESEGANHRDLQLVFLSSVPNVSDEQRLLLLKVFSGKDLAMLSLDTESAAWGENRL